MGNSNVVGAGRDIVLAIGVSIVTVDGDGRISWNNVELDGRNFGSSPNKNTDENDD